MAILCSDIHLSERPPIARSAEPDWYAAMARPLDEISRMVHEHNADLIVAGDIFDKPCPRPELVNFAIRHLPKCTAVPGQHDLLHHSYEDLKKTAYYTLMKAGVITNITPDVSGITNERSPYCIYGFPWGFDLHKREDVIVRNFSVAVVHHFCWSKKSTKHEGATQESNVSMLAQKLKGFDLAVFGDNHKPFFWYPDERRVNTLPTIYNCGGLMRRTISEINHAPRVGLLFEDRFVGTHELDCSKDKFIDVDAAVSLAEDALGMTDVVSELRQFADKGFSFLESLKRFCSDNAVGKSVVKQILKASEKQ